ncbi:hypothetical protein FB99_28990 [Pantoea agglomerans]|nr:hypothetical protein FB99_28990 [Pantoea agglomerans]
MINRAINAGNLNIRSKFMRDGIQDVKKIPRPADRRMRKSNAN